MPVLSDWLSGWSTESNNKKVPIIILFFNQIMKMWKWATKAYLYWAHHQGNKAVRVELRIFHQQWFCTCPLKWKKDEYISVNASTIKLKNIIKTPTYNQLGCSWLNPFHIYSWIVDILFHSLLSKRHKLWRCRRDTHNHKSQPQ